MIIQSDSLAPKLKEFLQNNLAIVNEFQALLTPVLHKKGFLLHENNKICKSSYFIEKGAARASYFKDGKNITAYFAFEGESITAIDSLLQGKISKYSIELLEDSSLYSITYADIEVFFTKSALHERFGRYYLQQVYIDLVDRVENLQFHTAKERYNILIEKHPHIVRRVELRHIASYLGITNETLSRIRTQK